MAETANTYIVSGVCCSTEESVLRKKLDKTIGSGRYTFNLVTSELRVSPAIPAGDIIREVRTAGFDARVKRRIEERQRFWQRHGETFMTGAAMMMSFGGGLLETHDLIAGRGLLLSAILLGGWRIFLKAFAALRLRTLDMNALMSIAVIGALAIGKWTEAAMVIVLFAIALMLERRSTSRARRALQSLLALAPNQASLLRDGVETVVPADDVHPGDTVVVRPGERVPVDGIVVAGTSTVNEAPITGESVPVLKETGLPVYSGAINGRGVLTIRVTAEHEDSTLRRLIHLVEEAQTRRAPIQSSIERFSKVYTPSVLGIAILVAVVPPLFFAAPFEGWLYRALVMLVIACPCALVISTPVTLVSALTNAARAGILIKGGRYLEVLGKTQAIAFDKTGTLTEGRIRIVAVAPLGTISEDEAIRIAAAIEHHSEHHLAGAILEEAAVRNLQVNGRTVADFEALPGLGIRATIDGIRYFLGNRRFAEQENSLTAPLAETLDRFAARGLTTVVLARESVPVCVFALEDRARSHGRRAVEELRQLGIPRMIMLSGDQAAVAQRIAESVGLEYVRAGLLPEAKVHTVEELRTTYGTVVMVGDGINDAPALAAASVGVAMGVAGTDIALESADVVLMSDDLLKLPYLLRLSRKTLRIIRQNIAIALGLKAVFFLLNFAGHASLWMALLADDGATLAVILNGLRVLGRDSPVDAGGTGSSVNPDQPREDV